MTQPQQFLDYLEWLDLQPEHQPQPSSTPRMLPPVQPSPLINGLIQAVLSASPNLPPTTVNTRLVGADNIPLTTLAPTAPGTQETLFVSIAPSANLYRATAAAVALIAGGGTIALPAALISTRITALSIGVGSTVQPPSEPTLEFRLSDSAGQLVAASVVTGSTPWTSTYPSGLPVSAPGPLTLTYNANLGSLLCSYVVSGQAP